MQKNRTISFAWAVACAIASPSLMAATPVPLSPAPAELSKVEKTSSTIGTTANAQPEKSYYYFEAVPVRPVEPSKRQSSVSGPAAAAPQTQAKVTTSAITPLCTTLNTGTTYTLDSTTTGGSYCYHFEITQRAKTTVFLTGQNANTDFALTLIKHEADDTLTSLGTSDQPGNADEGLLALTEPGDYYWSMDANASDGSAFQFGAVVNTAVDANELNDAASLSTPIPDDRTPIVGSMDSAQDIDYFSFVAENGQDLQIQFTDTYGQNEWVIEYFTGTTWTSLNANQVYNLSGLPAPFTLNIRISPNPSMAVNPNHDYELVVGSTVTASDMVDVGSSENLARIGAGDFSPFLVDQAYNELDWSIRVLDSNGDPVEGAIVNFRYATTDIAEQVDTAVSNSAGIAGSSITLPNCTGNNSVIHTSGGNTWLSEFDIGAWAIDVENTDPDEVGVGGENYPAVTWGHICDQTLQ